MSFKLIAILKEVLDVSWNPYEEKFKVGDKVKEIYGDEELCRILDKRRSWNEVETNPIKKSYIPIYIPADPEVEKESWYLVQYLEYNANRKPVWVPESNLEAIKNISEALDVSWNPYEERDIKQYDELLNAFIRDVLKMAKDRSIYSRGLKKSEIPSEVYEQLRFEHDMHEGEISGLDAIMENFSEDEVLERITKLLSRFNLKEALDVSWNPYEQANYANKFYEFVDYDYSEGGPTALVFFRDEDGNDLGAIVDLETKKILDASTWSGEGDEDVNLHLKIVEQLNQNKHIKDILRRWVHHINTDLVRRDLSEDLDVSWNPYEEINYTNKFYEIFDFDFPKDSSTALIFFKDDEDTDLKAIVDLKTRKVVGASEWSGEGGDVDLDSKAVEELNQNEHIKDILHRWVRFVNEDLDISWNPYEDSNYTVLMGKIDTNKAVIQNYHAKDEDGALVEFFMDYLHQNLYYAKIAINGTKKKFF